MKAPNVNHHDFRESWLRAAATELRKYFTSVGYTVPDKIRFAIAFPSTGRKGKRVGECWHSASSDDGHYEIFLRADLSDAVEILGVLTKELGPLPHARLDIEQTPLVAVAPAPATALDRPKKQRGRMLKAECTADGCGYIIRIAAKWAHDPGPPQCPKHGQPLAVEFPRDDEAVSERAEQTESV
jgi:hypothetical protein